MHVYVTLSIQQDLLGSSKGFSGQREFLCSSPTIPKLIYSLKINKNDRKIKRFGFVNDGGFFRSVGDFWEKYWWLEGLRGSEIGLDG